MKRVEDDALASSVAESKLSDYNGRYRAFPGGVRDRRFPPPFVVARRSSRDSRTTVPRRLGEA